MFKSKFTGTKRTIALFICSFICILLCISQIISGVRMIKENNDAPYLLTYKDYDSFKEGQVVNGVITEYVYRMDENSENGMTNNIESGNGSLILYFAKSDTGKIMLFRAPVGSELASSMQQLHDGKISEVYYKGKVRTMSAKYSQAIKQELFFKRFNKAVNINKNDVFLELMIDMSPTNAAYSQKAITATFVGAVLMFLIAGVFLIKPIKNAAETILSDKGKYKPKLAVTKDDLEFEMEGFYTGNEQKDDEFFVNTGYNIRNYGAVNKDEESPADRSQLPTSKDDPAMNRGEKGEPLFYTGEVNEEGNFYVDSRRDAATEFGKESQIKRY